MRKNFKHLVENLPAERQTRIKQKAMALKEDMALAELRRALGLTQKEVAASLGMKQAAISKFERQPDITIGTLRKILSGMGAELKIVARFKDTGDEIVIDQFDEVA